MSRYSILILGLIFASALQGCGSNETYTLPDDSESTTGAETSGEAPAKKDSAVPELRMTTKNMELYMHDDTLDAGQEQKPTFIVRADSGSALVSDTSNSSFALTLPKAIIFSDDREEVNLHAKSGVFDGESEIATLDGGVKVFSPRLNLAMESIVWNNKSRTGQSDAAITLISEWANLEAIGMTLHPTTGQLILTNVTGTLTPGASQ